jgi:hypothetical protein
VKKGIKIKTMSGNRNLNQAAINKEDEFYTRLDYVENELKNYKEHFRNKVVYCNCDDPRESAFFHYFSYNFQILGLKKLITTCYKNQSRDLFSKMDTEDAIYLEYNGERTNSLIPSAEEIGIHKLNGDGDFRSEQCINLLKQADIVVTNPPFSLFRDYIAQLIEYDKQFIILGPINAITYKETFPLIKEDKVWIGATEFNKGMYFNVGEDFEYSSSYRFLKSINGTQVARVAGICWYTNIHHNKRNEEIILYKTYTKEEYPRYDNYDAININKVEHIPKDYYLPMGVPITFIDKHNRNQFKILGNLGSYGVDGYSLSAGIYINGAKIYKRLLIIRV